jgi:Flp pilus assembly pilin Flp
MTVFFRRNKSGQTLVEYALILVVVSITILAAMILLRGQVSIMYNSVTGSVENQI